MRFNISLYLINFYVIWLCNDHAIHLVLVYIQQLVMECFVIPHDAFAMPLPALFDPKPDLFFFLAPVTEAFSSSLYIFSLKLFFHAFQSRIPIFHSVAGLTCLPPSLCIEQVVIGQQIFTSARQGKPLVLSVNVRA